MTTAIWWLRRDLRLADNQALLQAAERADKIIPLFILDPALLNSKYVGPKRISFLFANLRELDLNLRSKGSRLILRQGDPLQILNEIVTESGAQAIYAETDYSPYARKRDERISRSLPIHLVGSPCVFPPEFVLKPDGTPYKTFTPFCKTWKSLPDPGKPLPAPSQLVTPESIASLEIPIPAYNEMPMVFQPGEAAAHLHLERFTIGFEAPIGHYDEDRNILALEGTSGLSPYLRFGILSARQAVHGCRLAISNAGTVDARNSAETWLNELIWREFFISILYYFPHARQESFQEKMRYIPWHNDPLTFDAWKHGKTGFPVVDAGMRQLIKTGWMHNRARMITASFLTKHLLIDWRWGEMFFMQHLIDGDPASNNGGWQWTAGTGVDAAPYFRVFNPITQGEKFDSDGVYIRRWVPELKEVPTEYIHQPWSMPEWAQDKYNCRIGRDYPFPIVDHATARQLALDTFSMAQKAK